MNPVFTVRWTVPDSPGFRHVTPFRMEEFASQAEADCFAGELRAEGAREVRVDHPGQRTVSAMTVKQAKPGGTP